MLQVLPDTVVLVATSRGPTPTAMFLTSMLVALVTALATGLATYLVQQRKLKADWDLQERKLKAEFDAQERRLAAEFQRERERMRTEFMAEQVARQLLMHKHWTKRSFPEIKRRLTGFPDDELRKILVRAGAVRFGNEDTELWGLLERNSMDEWESSDS